MSGPADIAAVEALLERAHGLYADDPAALAIIGGYRDRLTEPLRVAIGGMVKAGKSTLLNAMLGDEIAPTDAGECTTIVTWYRYAHTPRIWMHRRDGSVGALPVHRVGGRLDIRLGGEDPDEVERIVVDWPASSLRDVTIIDTPGIASLSTEVSARTASFLVPERTASEADALIYLVRALHGADMDFLRAYHRAADAAAGTVSAIAVLSRADEIGAGRLDSLLSARGVAERYRSENSFEGMTLAVLPIAGLLAQTARTLRQSEFDALASLAALGRSAREKLLVSVDRFATAEIPGIPPEQRAALLDRFGLFGLRLASVLLKDGEADSTTLAHELARRSGLHELVRSRDDMLTSRAAALKTRSAIAGLRLLMADRPREGAHALAAEIERVEAGAHPLRELAILAEARTTGLPLPQRYRGEAERVLGGQGTSPRQRLGLPEAAPEATAKERAALLLERWQRLRASPLISRPAARVCDAVIRSCEAVTVDLGTGYPAWRPPARRPASAPRNQAAADGSRAAMTPDTASAN